MRLQPGRGLNAFTITQMTTPQLALAATLARFPLALKRDALASLLSHRTADGHEPNGDGQPTVENALPVDASGVLVLPIRGLIAPRIEDVGYCDCTVTLMDRFMATVERAKTDGGVKGVLLDISSPGGIALMVPEAAAKLRELAKLKPVHAVANAEAYSAAYYLMAAAGKRYVTRSGGVGSVGVWCMHVDQSKMLEEWGITVTLISEGEHKVDGNPFEPLSKEVREAMQADTRETYEMFRDDVAGYVGVSPETIEKGWQARCVSAPEAVELGMVDGISTFDEVLANLRAELQPKPELAADPEARSSSDVEKRSGDGFMSVTSRDEGKSGMSIGGTSVRYRSGSVDLGGFREEFEAGAFDESIPEDDIRVIWQHDPKYVFGRVRAGTATATSDTAGLHYTATPPDAQWARDAVESIRRGDVTQNSFAFYVPEPKQQHERWERRKDGLWRVVTKARLIETGPQTNPAYPDTSVAVRSMQVAVAEHRVIDMTTPEAPRITVPSLDLYRDRLKALEASL